MDDQGKKQVALLCDQSPTYAAGYAAGIEIGREAGMREAANISAIFGDCANPLTNSHKTMVHLTASEIERAIISAIDK